MPFASVNERAPAELDDAAAAVVADGVPPSALVLRLQRWSADYAGLYQPLGERPYLAFDPVKLCAELGPGRYRAQLFTRGVGRSGCVASWEFVSEDRPAAPAPTGPTPSGSSLADALILRMLDTSASERTAAIEAQAQMFRALAERRSGLDASVVSSLITAGLPLLARFLDRRTPVSELRELLDTVQHAAPDADPTAGPSSPGPSVEVEVVRQLGPILRGLLSAPPPRTGADPPPRALPTPSSAATPTPSSAATPTPSSAAPPTPSSAAPPTPSSAAPPTPSSAAPDAGDADETPGVRWVGEAVALLEVAVPARRDPRQTATVLHWYAEAAGLDADAIGTDPATLAATLAAVAPEIIQADDDREYVVSVARALIDLYTPTPTTAPAARK